MRVAGCDVSRGYAVFFVMTTFPDSPKSHSLKKGSFEICTDGYKITCDQEGVNLLESLNLDMILLEPTGFWYSDFWRFHGKRLGIKMYWVSHQSLCSTRSNLKFKNKDDLIDAFCLGYKWYDPANWDNGAFTDYIKTFDVESLDNVRRAFLDYRILDKRKNSIINILRQRLNSEYPEIAQRDFEYLTVKGYYSVIDHILGNFVNPRIPKASAGTGLTDDSREFAQDIKDLFARLDRKKCLLELSMSAETFSPYLTVFDRCGFGTTVKAAFLLQCYPFERFLINGKIDKRRGRDHSLRQFQAYCGLSFTYEASGDTSAKQGKVKRKWHGSRIVRSLLFAWVGRAICCNKFVPSSSLKAYFRKCWLEPRERQIGTDNKGQPILRQLPSFQELGQDGKIRLCFQITRNLYYELKRELGF
jgi:hypothetical protein